MRKILFRAKHAIIPHEWCYGELTSNLYDEVVIKMPGKGSGRVRKETIGQFTGAHDKNGLMIFEGDIIRGPDNAIGYVVYSVRYLDYRIIYFSLLDNREYTARLSDWGYGCTKLVVEVIDNIHDSPDYLMKQYSSAPKYADKEARDMDLVAMGQGIYEESLNG